MAQRYILLLFIITIVPKIICQFTPPAADVCLGGSITYSCTLNGRLAGEQFFIYRNLTTLMKSDLNSITIMDGVDLSRVSATVDNAQIPNMVFFSILRANITLVNITKEDNGTLIGCKSFNIDTISHINQSRFLILSSPPSPPTLHLTPIPSNCTLMLHWDPPSSHLPILGYILNNNTSHNSIELNNDVTSYFSPPLPAGEEIRFNLTAISCVGESPPTTVPFTAPSRPNFTECSATYGTIDLKLVLMVSSSLKYNAEYEYNISNSNNSSLTIYSGSFTYNALNIFHSESIGDQIDANRSYLVSIRARLTDCSGSELTDCTAPLNITKIVPTTPTTTPFTTTTTSIISTTTRNSTGIPTPYVSFVYIGVAVVLFLILFSLVNVIIVLILILRKKSNTKYKSFSVREHCPDSKDSPDLPESKEDQPANPVATELHYIEPKFSNSDLHPKPQPLPKTFYSDIDHAKSTLEETPYAYIH